jgi:hypothetical protein
MANPPNLEVTEMNTNQLGDIVFAMKQFAEAKFALSNADDFGVLYHGEKVENLIASLSGGVLELADVDKGLALAMRAAYDRNPHLRKPEMA